MWRESVSNREGADAVRMPSGDVGRGEEWGWRGRRGEEERRQRRPAAADEPLGRAVLEAYERLQRDEWPA